MSDSSNDRRTWFPGGVSDLVKAVPDWLRLTAPEGNKQILWVIPDLFVPFPISSISADIKVNSDYWLSQSGIKTKIRTPYANTQWHSLSKRCGRSACLGIPLVLDSIRGIKTLDVYWSVSSAGERFTCMERYNIERFFVEPGRRVYGLHARLLLPYDESDEVEAKFAHQFSFFRTFPISEDTDDIKVSNPDYTADSAFCFAVLAFCIECALPSDKASPETMQDFSEETKKFLLSDSPPRLQGVEGDRYLFHIASVSSKRDFDKVF